MVGVRVLGPRRHSSIPLERFIELAHSILDHRNGEAVDLTQRPWKARGKPLHVSFRVDFGAGVVSRSHPQHLGVLIP